MQKKSGISRKSEIIADSIHYGKKVGTIQKGASLDVLLFVPRIHSAMDARAVIREDSSKGLTTIPMEWQYAEEDMDVFACRLPSDEVGLYWYYFEIDSQYGVQYSRASGGRVSFAYGYESMQPLQLTVYDRKYRVPEYLGGGLIYQVFVDRFCRSWYETEAGAGDGTIAAEMSAGLHDEEYLDAYARMYDSCMADQVKSRYHIAHYGEDFDNWSERGIYLHDVWGTEPEWRPDRHGEILNNDFFGGNLKGVMSKLPYLKSLGVTCIYLNPIFASYSSHRYDTGDYMRIDPLIGTEEEFEALCSRAGEMGMAVLLDGVFNHTGDDSIYFNKYGIYDSYGAWDHPDSEYRGWYEWKDSSHYNSWWQISTLPTVRKDSDGLRRLLFSTEGVIRKWIRLGACGWRLDVVDELPADFLRELVCAAKTERDDAVVLGEVWEDASNKIAYSVRRTYFQGEELDSVMNYPWKDAIISYLRDANAEGLGAAITDICTNYPPEVLSCLMNPLGTHDSVRVITALAGKDLTNAGRPEKARTHLGEKEFIHGYRLLKLAALIQMLLPGVPSIYYGDEIGMEGYNDPFNRKCFDWGREDKQLLKWYRLLGAMRSAHREFFANADCEVIHTEDGLFAFTRTYGEDRLLCIINRSSDVQSSYISGSWIPAWNKSIGLEKVYLGTVRREGEYMAISVPAQYGYLVLMCRKASEINGRHVPLISATE